MTDHAPHLAALAAQAHVEGGWGHGPGLSPHIESTCFGILALSQFADEHSATLAKAWEFLQRCGKPDGSYRQTQGREEAIWPTSLVLFTQLATGSKADHARTLAFTLGVKGRVPDSPEAGELHDINLKLIGWPWAENNFSWVEPTAWALLALRRAGHENHPRVQEGIAMLLDRAMDQGGINYGNRRVLGKMLDPIPTTTALMLLALQGIEHPRLTTAVGYLINEVNHADVEHRCWIKLALDRYRHVAGVDEALSRLDAQISHAAERRALSTWLRPGPMGHALTILALTVAKKNWFALAPHEKINLLAAEGEPAKPTQGAPRPGLGQRFGNWFKGVAAKAVGNLRPLPLDSRVHISRADNYDANLADILRGQYQAFAQAVPFKGKRVVLKPNLVEFHKDKVINTDPRVIAAVIELCQREGAAEVIVAEGPGHWRNVEFLVAESGLGEVLERFGVRFVDINHDEAVKLPNLGRLTGLDYLYVSKTVARADVFISLPKLKTHHWAGATLALKNLFGTLPGLSYGWPKNELHWRGIDNSIVDIALTRTPDLAIVDGIIGMEGDGPLNGVAKPFGALIMGADPLAVDATCCRLMCLDPSQIGYLMLGHAKKLGRLRQADIPQIGETIEALAQPFATVPHLDKLRLRPSA